MRSFKWRGSRKGKKPGVKLNKTEIWKAGKIKKKTTQELKFNATVQK